MKNMARGDSEHPQGVCEFPFPIIKTSLSSNQKMMPCAKNENEIWAKYFWNGGWGNGSRAWHGIEVIHISIPSPFITRHKWMQQAPSSLNPPVFKSSCSTRVGVCVLGRKTIKRPWLWKRIRPLHTTRIWLYFCRSRIIASKS